MSMAAKQMFLEELEQKIGKFLIVDDAKTVMSTVSDILPGYDVESAKIDRNEDDCLEAYLDAKMIEGRSVKTVERYRYILTKMVKAIGGISARQITAYHIRGYLMNEKSRGVSDGSLEGIRGIINAYFGWLWREGLIEKNPCANIGAIKCQKKIRLPYSAEDVERLKDACNNIRDRAIIHFLMSTGCRVSEICSLNRDDIDFNNLECKVIGKGNKERTVYLDTVTAMLLKRYILSRGDITPSLFIGKGTERLTPQGMRRMLKKLAEKAGIDNVHPHRFRRTLATNLINRGMPIQEVAFVLGHDRIDTTMKYVHIEKESVKSMYRKYS